MGLIDNSKKVVIFGLGSNKPLTADVCKYLDIKESDMQINHFADGEIIVQAAQSVRGKSVVIIQSTSPPVNENLMELLIAVDAVRRGAAKEIILVIPYFGYARQDRKVSGRQPITCKLVANLLTWAGANRIITIDLHSPQAQGFFDIPVDDIRITYNVAAHIKNNNLSSQKLVVVSPDQGGIARARRLAVLLRARIAVIDKRRAQPNQSEIEFILGDVKGYNAVIVDDMIDTAGTICNAARALKAKGALSVTLIATHAVFSDPAVKRLSALIKDGTVESVVVSDTIKVPPEKQFPGLKIISIGKFLAHVVAASLNDDSVTELFNSLEAKIHETYFDGKK